MVALEIVFLLVFFLSLFLAVLWKYDITDTPMQLFACLLR